MLKEVAMSLKEILERIIEKRLPLLLCERGKDWEAGELLHSLSEPMLKRRAHMQAGLYIAEINESGYLGQVLFTLKQKA
jgi:hypothetical protein